MRRETQNILLVLLGGALLKIAFNGDYLRYVRPTQQPWLIAGGLVIAVLAAVAIVRDIRVTRHAPLSGRGTDHPRSPPGGEHLGHQHAGRSAWMLVLPVLAVFLVAPPALGSDSVTRTQARAPQADPARASSFPPLPAEPVVGLPTSEFVTRAGWDSAGTLNGRTVALSGFIVHANGSTKLARMVITCCAADAFPVTVRLLGGQAGALESDTWVRVTGVTVPDSAHAENGYQPDLTVASIEQVAPPADPYEY